MIDRYTRKEMKQLWSEKTKFDALLEVEILAAEAWAELGEIPTEDTKNYASELLIILTVLKKSKQKQNMILLHLLVLSRKHLEMKKNGSIMV